MSYLGGKESLIRVILHSGKYSSSYVSHTLPTNIAITAQMLGQSQCVHVSSSCRHLSVPLGLASHVSIWLEIIFYKCKSAK
jgi:hypothetical protein